MVTVTVTSHKVTKKDIKDSGRMILYCYDLKLKVLSDKTTLVLSNTRELDRVPSTK